MNRLRIPVLALALGALLLSAACAVNPLAVAKTTQQQAFSVYGEFVAYEKVAAKLVQDPTVPEAAKTVLRHADAAAYPPATALYNATQEVIQIQADIAAGATTSDKLVIASASMQSWYDTSKPLVDKLIDAVSSKGKSP